MRKRVAVAKAAFFFFVRDELRRRELQLYVLRRVRRPRVMVIRAGRLRGGRGKGEKDGGGEGGGGGIIGGGGGGGKREVFRRGAKVVCYPLEKIYKYKNI